MSIKSIQPSFRQPRIGGVRMAAAIGCILIAGIGSALAEAPADDCPSIPDDRVRLACYDRLHGRIEAQPVPVESAATRDQDAPADGGEAIGDPSIDTREASAPTASAASAPAAPATDMQSRLST